MRVGQMDRVWSEKRRWTTFKPTWNVWSTRLPQISAFLTVSEQHVRRDSTWRTIQNSIWKTSNLVKSDENKADRAHLRVGAGSRGSDRWIGFVWMNGKGGRAALLFRQWVSSSSLQDTPTVHIRSYGWSEVIFLCVCVREWVCVCVCEWVCVWERERNNSWSSNFHNKTPVYAAFWHFNFVSCQ